MYLRVWAEYLKPEQADEEKTIDLLKKYKVNLGFATRADSLDASLVRMLRTYGENKKYNSLFGFSFQRSWVIIRPRKLRRGIQSLSMRFWICVKARHRCSMDSR